MTIQWRQAIVDNLLKKQRNICKICNNPFADFAPPEIDHIIPLSKGGKDKLENYQLLHAICNKKKYNKVFYTNNLGLKFSEIDSFTLKGRLLLYELSEIKNALIEMRTQSLACQKLSIPRRRITYLMYKYKLPKNPNEWIINSSNMDIPK